ncbi:hypothetical protein HU742_018060 [Pseudomonas sp. SWRI102]|uniref:Uncharacterized protein n=1 Tax=Pseudomonas marvdashtae TaxID=2745500 RepID=A0A923FLQ9_9PSED|nr:hypothetical protein [Pseudomonas marvdashtae]MBV4553053.1 hypothetical protein [Pseudomonas marvdashtae]
MKLFRVEVNVMTGSRAEIEQRAYRLGDSVIVLDADEIHPDGYAEFDPNAEDESQ